MLKPLEKQTVMVTGGAGFIGSHLCEKLLKEGCRVICVDNLNNFYDTSLKLDNIQDINRCIESNKIKFSRFSFFIGDILDSAFLKDTLSEFNIETIVHLAAYAGVRPSIANPELYVNVNINGTLNLLEYAKNHSIKNFIFASSSSVYGNNKKVPFSESDPVDNPISPYAASKKAGELLCHTYHHLYNMNMACLRFFTVFGPRQRPDLAIHKFTRLMFEEREIPYYGNGFTQRDYTYIDDIVDGIVKAIRWAQKEDGKYDIFNLGESNTITLRDMVKTLEEKTGRKARLQTLPAQPGDVEKTYADITRAREILGYDPRFKFEEGIEIFVKWYKDKFRVR
jgi:UDP-glucuronate 4-epimerase